MPALTDDNDPYRLLRPESPTPADESCRCADTPPIVLQDHLSSVPLACLRCNGEVPPEKIGLPALLAQQIAAWRNVYRALYTLWLDSREYEAWAKSQLMDPGGSVNVRGLEVVAALGLHRPTYYWWFDDATEAGPADLCHCPRCRGPLVESHGSSVCNACAIVLTQAGARGPATRWT